MVILVEKLTGRFVVFADVEQQFAGIWGQQISLGQLVWKQAPPGELKQYLKYDTTNQAVVVDTVTKNADLAQQAIVAARRQRIKDYNDDLASPIVTKQFLRDLKDELLFFNSNIK